MDFRGLGDAMNGLVGLAMFGLAALYVLALGGLVGLVWFGIWAWNHVSIH